jgi:uncharacterized membrane protein YuzA (DUF378 family)
MATMNPPASERRHISDRRTSHDSLHKVKLNALDWIAMVLMIIGGLNWGLVGLINYDVLAGLFGTQSAVARTMYVVVGVAALYAIYTSAKMAASGPASTH